MTNKINISQEQSEYRLTVRGERVKKVAKRAVQAVGVGVAGGILTAGAVMLDNVHEPDMVGDQTVQIDPGDTLHDLIKDKVENGANHVGEVAAEVEDDPRNIEVFEGPGFNPGEQVHLPERVDEN